MIAILHALVDIIFFVGMTWLCERRLDELEERLRHIEAREQADSREVNYLMERAELQSER